MSILSRSIFCVFSLFCFTQAHAAESLDKIVLQLPWHHQFQFAGYYAAVEQGYYKDAGFDVTLESGSPEQVPVSEVLAGRAQYGVARSELLLHRMKGKPVVALAAVFQHSAIILLARQDSAINTPHDMIGHKVMLREGDDSAEHLAIFQSAGVSLDEVDVISSSFDIQDLVQGKTDVFNAYITNEPFFLEQRGIPYTIIKPSDYGIDFYGDTLFTSEDELTAHPDRVKAFRAASMRGWEYALTHHEDIIELLISTYEVTKSKSHLRYEAHAIQKLILPGLVEIGHMLPERWEHMAQIFAELDMADADYSLDNFIYIPNPEPDYTQLRRQAVFFAILFVLTFIIILLYFNRRLHLLLADRTYDLKRSEKLFREIYNNMDSGVAIYEAINNGNDFIFKDLNPAGLKSGQIKKENIINKSVRDVFPGVVELGLFDVFQQVWQTGTSMRHPSKVYKDDRIILWVENYVCKLPSGEIVVVYDDITPKKKAEEVLQKNRDELEQRVQERTKALEKTHEQLLHAEKLSSVGRFSASIAHEFNNPLQGILNVFGRVQERATLDTKDQELVGLAVKECHRMRDLINNLQQFNKPTSGIREVLNIHQVIDEVLLFTKEEFKNKKITIKKEYATNLPDTWAVADQIKQVFVNILGNAADAVGAEGGTITLTTILLDEEHISISIKDSGEGISPENIKEIFEPFYSTKAIKGTGLGLSVSYGIIKSHGGVISVESEVGQGTTVTITLPI